MEISEIVSVTIILVAIVLWNLVNVWQIRSHTNRLIQEIRAMGASLSEVEREQVQQEQTP